MSAPINNADCVLAQKQNSDFCPNKRALIASEVCNILSLNSFYFLVFCDLCFLFSPNCCVFQGSPDEYDATKHVNNVHDGNLYVEVCKEGETDTSVR